VSGEDPAGGAREGGFLVSRVHLVGQRAFARMLREAGLEEYGSGTGRIFFALWREESLGQKELAERTGMDKSTLALTLDRLEAEGRIARQRDPDDGRRTIVRASAETRRRAEEFARVSARMTELFYSGFSDTEIGAFEASLRRILGNLGEG
jgi:DNA-binding MarR family transcriptional regulator